MPTVAGEPTSTPWAGISGAALFANGALVGVIVLDPDRFPPDRLLATPLAGVAGDEGFAAALGRPGPLELIAVRADRAPGPRPDAPRPGPRRINWPPRPLLPLVGRAELVTELKAKLIAGEDVALFAGLPGAGKTALAHHLIRDDEVQAHFANILWTWLGTTPDVKGRLQVWAAELGITPQESEALEVDSSASGSTGRSPTSPRC